MHNESECKFLVDNASFYCLFEYPVTPTWFYGPPLFSRLHQQFSLSLVSFFCCPCLYDVSFKFIHETAHAEVWMNIKMGCRGNHYECGGLEGNEAEITRTTIARKCCRAQMTCAWCDYYLNMYRISGEGN